MVRFGVSLVLFALLCTACHAQRTADSASLRSVIELPPSRSEPSTQSRAPVARRIEVACQVHDDTTYATEVPVRLDPDSSPLLWVRGPHASLTIQASPRPLAVLAVEASDVVFETRYVPADLPLRPARAIVFERHVIPASRATFGFVSASAGLVTISYQLSDLFVDRAVLETRVPCDALALEQRGFEPAASLELGAATGETTISSSTPVAFYADAAGPEVGRHQITLDASVSTFSTHGDRTFIALDTTDELLFGWVATSALHGTAAFVGLGDISAGPSVYAVEESKLPWTSCNHELELVVRRGAERGAIGKMRVGASFAPRRARGDDTPVDIRSDLLRFAPNVELSVRSADLATCTPVE